ncbi:alpha/beta hydrolase [Shewanella olleyana]|uniref:alpha/beta hydrolase n=1 Tax=Shewanella olleyana TaxID=135626 RepID=UPI00200CADF6|nr:alpha/beta hydrolase [Shewanella olleyana]MCL1068536.1 alpha/beta hydrolase [Shewanella olleyana]
MSVLVLSVLLASSLVTKVTAADEPNDSSSTSSPNISSTTTNSPATGSPSTSKLYSDSLIVEDISRERLIPVELYYPVTEFNCSEASKCPVMILSSGYGLLHTEYQFISQHFQQQGYLVIAVRHELPSYPPLSRVQPFAETRHENWQRGADTLNFIQHYFSQQYVTPQFVSRQFVNQQYVNQKQSSTDSTRYIAENFDFKHITLVGHSNGGDISSLLANSGASNIENNKVDYISCIITLDHRRVPLPRDPAIKVLSIRASDYPADEGILPSEGENASNISVIMIDGSRHNDMNDYGPTWLKDKILNLIDEHMQF